MIQGAGRALLLLALLLLAACASKPPRADLPPREYDRSKPHAGDLYAPHLRDGGPPVPPDIARIPEPIPVPEPLARYGNRSPYTVLGKTYRVLNSASGYRERGLASWYGNKFHGRPTSSFEPYDMYKFTAAHKTLPLPSFARVTNLDNGRSVVVRVNDRGPFHDGRIIDLSYAAAVRLGMHVKGVGRVEVETIDVEDGPRLVQAPAAPVRSGERLHRSAMPAPTRPQFAPRSAHSGELFLQVGSFGLKDNARRLEDRLDDAGIDDVRLIEAEVGRSTVWRVRVGPLDDERDVEQVRLAVRRLGLGEPQRILE